METLLLELLACPVCRGKLLYDQQDQRLVCRLDRLIFLIEEGVPMMSLNHAVKISEESL